MRSPCWIILAFIACARCRGGRNSVFIGTNRTDERLPETPLKAFVNRQTGAGHCFDGAAVDRRQAGEDRLEAVVELFED
jgi:hypothetical protein